MTQSTATRLSNIELLRIFSVLGIVLMHGFACAMETTHAVNEVALVAVNAVCNMGVTLFVMISGFFGIRYRTSRLADMWLMILFYSLLTFGGKLFLDVTTPTYSNIFAALTPVSHNTYWFITCYVVVYCLAPFINKWFDMLTKREMQLLIITLSVFFLFVPTLFHCSLSGEPYGKSLPNFFLAYALGRYIALHGVAGWLNKYKVYIVVVLVAVIFTGNYVQPHHFLLCKDNSFLIVGGAIATFICFAPPYSSFNIQSQLINWLARFALPICLANGFLLRFIEPYYSMDINNGSFLWKYAVAQCLIVVLTIIIEVLRRTLLGYFTDRIASWADRMAKRMAAKLTGN